MLDLHVLLHNANTAWEAKCRVSIRDAVRDAGFRVDVHYLEGEAGHIGRSRARGYALGTQPYVTYVDNDDYLLQDALAALAPSLALDPDAIFPGELILQNGDVAIGSPRHHLACYRRDQLIDHTAWRVCGDLAQVNALDGKNVIDLPSRGYVHRVYASGGRLLRRNHLDELRRAYG